MNFPYAIYMIESGPALDMVKAHIADTVRVRDINSALYEELGATEGLVSRTTGLLTAVRFKGAPPEGWKKKDRKGYSRPKVGSAWSLKVAAAQGLLNPVDTISTAFSVPLCIETEGPGESFGSRCIGAPLSECGFLYMGPEGPYALWIPDVATEVAITEKSGRSRVVNEAKNFSMGLPGCRRIAEEEWEILVLQQKLREKQSANKGEQA